ncbi:hypothetical protein JMJ55_23145 [Belnapia sp. T6]|uniref:Uncharacterized protein n=1 Tax=Belnapia mucosa TaxID=2804532 RepID=A0ABS1V9A7_9PROT|nr:hypothetical protein [Belnapia mucosa]MBL6458238.1 hypothetical protein [Belnapia mucosa]
MDVGKSAGRFSATSPVASKRSRKSDGWLAARRGPIVPLLLPDEPGIYRLDMLLLERSTSTRSAAAGGNASLMALG